MKRLWISLLFAGACLAGDGGLTPPELVGRWVMRQGSGSSYVDPNTGASSAPNANVYQYRIMPDGHYEHSALISSSTYNCTMQIFGYETGVLELRGNRATFADQTAKIKSTDNCRPQWNYEKSGNPGRLSAYWRLDRDQYGVKLVFSNDKGQELVFYRQ